MLTKPLSHQERTGHFPVLPHQLLKILIVWLALSVVTTAAATAVLAPRWWGRLPPSCNNPLTSRVVVRFSF